MYKTNLVAIRDVTAQDANFVMATWLKGLRYGNDWFELIPSEVYFKVYHQVIEQILLRPKTLIQIACLKDEPDVILGYSVFEDSTLHFLFVKRPWRGIGIAKMLTPIGITTVSHLTKTGRAILTKTPGVTFNPF